MHVASEVEHTMSGLTHIKMIEKNLLSLSAKSYNTGIASGKIHIPKRFLVPPPWSSPLRWQRHTDMVV
jgi:hypothetical protein